MRRSLPWIAAGAAAALAPVVLAIVAARLESFSAEQARVRWIARDSLRRTEESTHQLRANYRKLKDAHYAPCSPADINLMRQIDIASTYIQAVGRLSGDSLVCTSLGTKNPIPIGPVQFVSEYATEERFGVRIPLAGNRPLDVVSKDGIAFLIDMVLPVDSPTEGQDVSVAMFVPSSPQHRILASLNGPIRPEWLRMIPKGAEVTFFQSGFIVYVVRSDDSDVAVAAAAPVVYATRQIAHFALILVPIGIICGGLFVLAVVYISRRRLSLPSILRAAARRREFYVEYQPIVDLATHHWVGAEALVRWRRGDHIVRPDSFIPIAEETGIVTLITRCVVEIVARDLPAMLQADREFSIAINLAAADLRSPATVPLLDELLSLSRARPANLEVEATERGLFESSAASDLIAAVRSRGISVAIDDFGTGYSSLSRLQTLALDTLKIDKAFVDTIGTDGATSQVVQHIIEMAQSLDLEMVAEGVETEEQAIFLAARGVHYAQGWLFGKPMSAEALCRTLSAQRNYETSISA